MYMDIKNKLMTVDEANELIASKRVLVIAGEEHVLCQLDRGNWIGGTIPYFMDNNGGVVEQNQVFVTDFSDLITRASIGVYSSDQISVEMLADRFVGGFSYVLLPAFSDIHQVYALKTREESHLFDVPTMGWITGVHLDEIGSKTPKVIDGRTGDVWDDKGCVLHCQLPDSMQAKLDIVNIYQQGEGDTITFLEDSFSCADCLVNGKPTNLADYYQKHHIDVSLPLVANYSGASINVSIQAVDENKGEVALFAPVLHTQEYKLAQPIDDLYGTFSEKLPQDLSKVLCSCNCILNYVNLDLEHKHSGGFTGPFTFGEIAYVLVNQTMVVLSVHNT